MQMMIPVFGKHLFSDKLKYMSKRTALFVVSSVLLTAIIGAATYTNYRRYKDIDRTKIPEKVETAKAFQKWITNAKNKKLELSADDFVMVEENEIYNTKWMSVYNIDEPGVADEDPVHNPRRESDDEGHSRIVSRLPPPWGCFRDTPQEFTGTKITVRTSSAGVPGGLQYSSHAVLRSRSCPSRAAQAARAS